jgi:small subunit ribosomal protein S4e
MVKNHLKRVAVPATWRLLRKSETFVTRPRGSLRFSMPIGVVLRDVLGLVDTAKAAKRMIHSRQVLVDGKPVRDEKNVLALMSVLSFDGIPDSYRLILDQKGKMVLNKLAGAEASKKLCKVIAKTARGKDRYQIGFHDGRTMLSGNEYGLHDTIVFALPSFKVELHLKLEKGASVYLMGGSNIGKVGIVDSVKGDVTVKLGDETVDTPKRNVFVLGKGKTIIDVGAK